MKEMNKKKKIIVWVLLVIGLLFIFQNYVWTNRALIKYFLKNDKYQQVNINIEDYVESHDCVLEENHVIITGDDPYIVYHIPDIWAYDIIINENSIKDYTGEYKIYFSQNSAFSENFVGEKEEGANYTYKINSNIQAIRIDFGVSNGEYLISEERIATINDNTKISQLTSIFCKKLFLVCLYIMFSYSYMIWLIYRKMYKVYYVNLIYIVLCSDIVVHASCSRIGILIIMAISLLLGMFLIQKNVSTEREKMKNE